MSDLATKLQHHKDMVTVLKIKSAPEPWNKIFEAVVDMLYAHQRGWDFRVVTVPIKKRRSDGVSDVSKA